MVRLFELGKICGVVVHFAGAGGIGIFRQQGQFPEVCRAMPIGLGPRAGQDVVQKGSVEDRRRQRMIMVKNRPDLGQDVPVAAVPVVRVHHDQLDRQIRPRPVQKELQGRLGRGHFQGIGKGPVFGLDILEIWQLTK